MCCRLTIDNTNTTGTSFEGERGSGPYARENGGSGNTQPTMTRLTDASSPLAQHGYARWHVNRRPWRCTAILHDRVALLPYRSVSPMYHRVVETSFFHDPLKVHKYGSRPTRCWFRPTNQPRLHVVKSYLPLCNPLRFCTPCYLFDWSFCLYLFRLSYC